MDTNYDNNYDSNYDGSASRTTSFAGSKGRKTHDRSAGTRPKAFSDASADEAKQAIKQVVSRGVATIAGAVEGFADTMRDSRLAETTKDALELAGQTIENVTRTTKEQALRIRDAAMGTASALGDNLGSRGLKQARDSGALGSTAKAGDSFATDSFGNDSAAPAYGSF